jgi:hypothetical protein
VQHLSLYPLRLDVRLCVRLWRVAGFWNRFTIEGLGVGLIVLGGDMIWWGYAGFSGVIAVCVAVMAAIVGLSPEIMVKLAGVTGGGLLAAGAAVHLIILMLRATARSAKRAVVAPRVEPAFLRTQVTAQAAGAPVSAAALLKPVGKAPHGPGALAVLFPQAAR